jgi:hypothetical protein
MVKIEVGRKYKFHVLFSGVLWPGESTIPKVVRVYEHQTHVPVNFPSNTFTEFTAKVEMIINPSDVTSDIKIYVSDISNVSKIM